MKALRFKKRCLDQNQMLLLKGSTENLEILVEKQVNFDVIIESFANKKARKAAVGTAFEL